MRITQHISNWIATAAALGLLATDGNTQESIVKLEAFVTEGSAIGDLGAMSTRLSDSIFGIDLSLNETPRSVSVVTSEMIDQFSVSSLNDIIKLTPGTFTSSFFGIEGSLEIRGSTSETYFRGFKRLDNPGHFPTPIGAAERIEVVRGPASPIFGPGKIGGYLNFVPKSARASTGRYLEKTSGSTKISYGSWDKRVAELQFLGPLKIPGTEGAGYSAYVMVESSGSFYTNSFQDQRVFQVSLDADLSSKVRVESGAMYHYWNGTENAGWNRITQELIDSGKYLRGRAQNFDLNNDGRVDGNEYNRVGGIFELVFVNPDGSVSSTPFGPPLAAPTNPNLALDPADPLTGTFTTLSAKTVMIDSIDQGESDSFLAYFDLIADSNPNLGFQNRSFFEFMDRWKTASYGFSQSQKQNLFENKTVVNHRFEPASFWKVSNSYSASLRRFESDYHSDFAYEVFERRDLSQGSSSRDRFWTWYERPELNPLPTVLRDTLYYNYGFSVLSHSRFGDKLNLLLGGRVDYLDVETKDKTLVGMPTTSNNATENTYNVSLSYELPIGLHAYATAAESSTLNVDQDGSVSYANVLNSRFTNQQELFEAGLKGTFLDNRLYAASAIYEQKTSSFSDQNEANQSIKARGLELELRYALSRNWTFLFNGTWQETTYSPLSGNANFNFLNTAQTGFSGTAIYGGTVGGVILDEASFPERSGQPNRVLSTSAIYTHNSGFGANITLTHIAAVAADRLRTILLPEANLLDLGFFYKSKTWQFQFNIANVTNERWFRSNFPELFGGVVVIPQIPRSYKLSATYNF